MLLIQCHQSMVCEERLVKDIAIVDIYYGSQFATKLNKGLTATFTDKLASIGKCFIVCEDDMCI